MPFDKGGLLNALIFDIALPEITSAIRRHHAATGELPTDEQVTAALQADRERIVGVGQSYLDANGFSAPPSGDPRGQVVTGSTGD